MCGRFTLTQDRKAIVEDLEVAEWSATGEHRPRFNVAPTQSALVLTWSDEAPGSHRVVRDMRWGLVPGWAKDPAIASKLINARGESIAEKPSFRNLVGRRRCAVLTDGFFEWKKDGKGSVPHYVHDPAGRVLPMAGLWDAWKAPDGTYLTTFTIVTTEARSDISFLHDRMPVILARGDLDTWRDVAPVPKEKALELVKSYAGPLETFPVSKLVNSVRYDSAEIVRRADPEIGTQGSLF